MDLGLEGRTAIVCGASSGMGLGIAASTVIGIAAVVPEPSTVLLLGSGLVALFMARARMRASKTNKTANEVKLCGNLDSFF